MNGSIYLYLDMTTKEAFEQLISQRGWYEPLGVSKNTAWGAVDRYKQGKLSIEKIEDLLLKAGFVVEQEKLWIIKT